MKLHLAVFTAAALIGAAPAFAQSSTGSMGTGGTSVAPGAAANGTTPGALGNGTNQSLQPSTGGTGLGYNPGAESWGYAERPGFPDLQPERCDAARDRAVSWKPRQHRVVCLRRRHRWHGQQRQLGFKRFWHRPGKLRRATLNANRSWSLSRASLGSKTARWIGATRASF